jgi:cell division septation protein DedD
MRKSALIVATTLASVLVLATLAGCSREKIDWKSAEAADTVEGYDHFIERHPDSALTTQARTRIAQLNEDRDWKKATAADTADAYRQFLAQHESGKWSEEARIRIENFSLDGTADGPAKPTVDAQPAVAASAPTPTPAAPGKSASEPKPSTKPGSALNPAADAKHLVAAATKAPSAGKPPPATPAEAATTSSYGIQLGAFHTQDAALKSWKALQVKFDSDLHGLFAHAVPVRQDSGQLFRLQAPVGEEARARAICASLARQSQPCVVVLPAPK